VPGKHVDRTRRHDMRRWTTRLVTAAAVAALGLAAGAAAAERAFDDTRGDGGDGADITRVAA